MTPFLLLFKKARQEVTSSGNRNVRQCHSTKGADLPLDCAPISERKGLRPAEEDRRAHARDAHRLLLPMATAVAVAVAAAAAAGAGERRRVGQRRPGGEEAAGQQRGLRVQPLDGVHPLPDGHLDADDAGGRGRRRRVGPDERVHGGPELAHGVVRSRRGRQRARLAHAHRAAVPGARRAPVHGQRARQARPSPHL